MVSRAYREKRACNAILSVKTSKSLLLLRIALSVINYCYGIRRVNGIWRHRLTILLMADHRWADQAEEEHCTTPSGVRGARPRQPKRTEKDRDFASVRYCSSLVGGQMLCSRSAAGRHSAIDRQQFRFTCVSADVFICLFAFSCRFVSWSFHGASCLGEFERTVRTRALYVWRVNF